MTRPSPTALDPRWDEAAHAGRVDGYNWTTVGADLDAFGCATLQKLLSPQECEDIAALYP